MINLEGVDCFTLIEYIEAMRLSASFSEFKENLKKIRYKSGEVAFDKRNHFFTDWREFNANSLDDVTKEIGSEKTVRVQKLLNEKEDKTVFIPGISPVIREIIYIPSDTINEAVTDKLLTGDYVGIYSGKKVDNSQLFEIFYGKLENAPMIKGCPINIECKLVDVLDYGGADQIIISEIIESYIDEKYLTDGNPDVEKMNPFLKRRIEQERQEFSRSANAELMLGLLPVLDDLERAVGAIPPGRAGRHGWAEGVRLVARNFRSALEAQGVTPIKALGEPFDPNFHEALRQGRGKEGIVIEEYQKGYRLGDRVLRPARVAVGNGEEVVKEENEHG